MEVDLCVGVEAARTLIVDTILLLDATFATLFVDGDVAALLGHLTICHSMYANASTGIVEKYK